MIGNRVRLAREVLGLTQAQLAEKINTTQSGVASIEANLYRPSPEYVDLLAKVTGFGRVFFESPTVDEFPSGALLYRARAALKKTERQQAHGLTSLAFELEHHLGIGLKRVPVNLPRLSEETHAAQIVRAALGVSPLSPITDLMRVVERSGVLVLFVPQQFEALDGYAAWVGAVAPRPVIALLGGKSGYRSNFTLAEELGHLVLHSPLRVGVSDAERQAKAFAQELLLPKEAILEEVLLPVTLSGLSRLKPRWHVSLQFLIRRCHDLELLTANQYRYLNQQVRARLEPGDEQIQQPRPRLMRKMAELRYGMPVRIEDISLKTGIPDEIIADLLSLPRVQKRGRVLPFPTGAMSKDQAGSS